MGAVPVTEAAGIDVRVLIDLSGSMRQNDPKNLRRPALRLLVGLLPQGTEAGVWTFARWANPLVPHGRVDGAWKQRAIALSEEIASPGQFTHIEEVLRQAARGWVGTEPAAERHLLLLTDGVVDVSKEPGASAASRARILNELLPKLQAARVRIHTIALSGRADHELLRSLATATDGWYQEVGSAGELQRVFLRIFEKVGRPDAVPLTDNRFRVDKNISEATVLAFRPEGSPPSRLHAPDGTVFDGNDVAAGVAWHSDQGYDLITIDGPQAGEWRLEAEQDPDNRVMIVTDLKLEIEAVPNRLTLGESFPLVAYLSSKGTIIDRPGFLDLVNWRVEERQEKGRNPVPVNDRGEHGDERPGDGRYAVVVGRDAPPGSLTLVVSAKSATFAREKQLVVDVAVPAALADEPAAPVTARVEGIGRAGNPTVSELGPVYPPDATSVPPRAKPVTPPERAPAPPARAVTVGRDAAPHWVLPAALFGGFNLLLIGGGLAWWLLAGRRQGGGEIVLVDVSEPALRDDSDVAFGEGRAA
ncbi:MAG: VWA domain-containing protein [Gammaproteobacteria bacterium]